MKSPLRVLCLVTLVLLTAATAGSQVPLKNHSFDIDAAGATVCENGAQFVGSPNAATALGIPLTSQVFDQVGATLRATGSTFTFTSVGQMNTFTVTYPIGTYTVGEFIGLSVSDMPPMTIGSEGDFDNSRQVADCLLPMAPSMPSWALAALLLLLLGSGFWLAGKAPRAFASTGRRRRCGSPCMMELSTLGIWANRPATLAALN